MGWVPRVAFCCSRTAQQSLLGSAWVQTVRQHVLEATLLQVQRSTRVVESPIARISEVHYGNIVAQGSFTIPSPSLGFVQGIWASPGV